MTAIAEILKTLGASRDGVVSSAEVFPLLDLDQIANELRVVERGEVDGRANLPATDDWSQTAAETDIRAEIDRRAGRALRDYQAQLDLYDGRIKRAAVVANMRTSIEAAGEGALADFRVQSSDDLSNLESFRREVQGRQAELNEFRDANGLRRLPRHERDVWLRGAFLLLFVVVESLMNGMLFAEGSEAGRIGGVAQAMILSLLNVATGFTFGRYGVLQLRHKARTRATLGVVSCAVYGVATILLNLSIGHYRDLFVQNAGNVRLSILWSSIHQGPLDLADARSLLLVLVGLGFSVLSAFDAAGLDDPYPGYGHLGRRVQEAIEQYGHRRSDCIGDLQERRDSAVAQMTEVIESVRAKEHDITLALNGRVRLQQQYSAFIDHLAMCHARLIQRYREANVRSRTTPAPQGFTSVPGTPTSLAPSPELSALTPDRETMHHVIERMEFFIREIRMEYEHQATRYPAVTELLGGSMIGSSATQAAN